MCLEIGCCPGCVLRATAASCGSSSESCSVEFRRRRRARRIRHRASTTSCPGQTGSESQVPESVRARLLARSACQPWRICRARPRRCLARPGPSLREWIPCGSAARAPEWLERVGKAAGGSQERAQVEGRVDPAAWRHVAARYESAEQAFRLAPFALKHVRLCQRQSRRYEAGLQLERMREMRDRHGRIAGQLLELPENRESERIAWFQLSGNDRAPRERDRILRVADRSRRDSSTSDRSAVPGAAGA